MERIALIRRWPLLPALMLLTGGCCVGRDVDLVFRSRNTRKMASVIANDGVG